MRQIYILLIAAVVLFSCKKEKEITIPAVLPLPAPAVLLKDIVIPNLPSPYYHFEYNTAGKITFVSFASDLTRYNIVYRGNRISEMRNNIIVNKDRLKYVYDSAGRVSTVRYTDSTGVIYTRVHFTYDEQKLIKVRRDRRLGTSFVTDKILTLSYYPDGNLLKLIYHYPSINGQPKATYADLYEQYDSKINVDGFGLIHNDFFDHLVLLPEVQLQKNNPGKETRTGDGINYTNIYTYTYNKKNLPLTKTGKLTISNGTDAGKRFQTNSTFSYY